MKTINLPQILLRLRKSPTQKVMSITFAGMILGLLLDILIAARLGAGLRTDALIIALSVPLLIETVIRESTKFSLVTYVMSNKSVLTPVQYRIFLSSLLNLFLIVGLATTVICWISAPIIVKMIGWGLTPDSARNATTLLTIMSPLAIFTFGVTVLNAILTSEKRFSFVALRNSFTPIAVIFLIAVRWKSEDVIIWIAVGYIVGLALYFVVLWVAVKKTGFSHLWRAWPDKSRIFGVFNCIAMPSMSFIVTQVSKIIERSIASLVMPGGVAIYYFGFRIFSALQTLVGNTIAMTGLPNMKEKDLLADKISVSRLLIRSNIRIILISVPLMLSVIYFSDSIVSILYERGSFSVESSSLTSNVLFWLALGLPFANLLPVLNSALYTIDSLRAVLFSASIMAVANLSMSWMLSRSFGLSGIAMGLLLSLPLTIMTMVIALHRNGIATYRFRNV